MQKGALFVLTRFINCDNYPLYILDVEILKKITFSLASLKPTLQLSFRVESLSFLFYQAYNA